MSRNGLRRVVMRGGLGLLAVVLGASALAAPATAQPIPHDIVVSDTPTANTPWINDGRVFAITQVGDTVIAGGTFGAVSASGGSPSYTRTGIVAFSASTGAVSTAFNPQINGTVNSVEPGPVPGTVLVGGAFSTVNGSNIRGVVLLNLSDGSRNMSFTPPALNGAVNDLEISGSRLYVGGFFTIAGGQAHGGIAALNYTTGAIDHAFVTQTVTENHNYGTNGFGARAAVGLKKLAASPDGDTVVGIGNFRKVDGAMRDQAFVLDTGGAQATLADWRTRRFEPACAAGAYDTYVRDVDFSPDSDSFAVVATGAPYPGTLCDTVSNWDAAARGDAVEPTWVDDTGGDTLWSVAITGEAVYVGGHQRWQNNAGGRDRAVGGAVPRPGLAAIDPVAGVPLAWNPGRNPRGAGAFALTPTETGIWMGSDTEWIGTFDYRRPRIAFFPTAGGTDAPAGDTGGLPGSVYLANPNAGADDLVRRPYDGESTVIADVAVPQGGLNWANVRGAFVADGTLFYARDGMVYRRTFDGSTYGPETAVDPYNDPEWSDVSTGSGGTYRGVRPSFYNEIPNVRGMAYLDGKLYYTMAGQTGVFVRKFSVDSAIMANTRTTVPGLSVPAGASIFLADDYLYYVHPSDGSLWRVGFDGAVSGTATKVQDTVDWRAGALFVGPGGGPVPNQAPTAAATVSCDGLTCTFDAAGSTDPDDGIETYAWDFGDGSTGAGETVEHTYPWAGDFEATLTVTDGSGETDEFVVTAGPESTVSDAPAFRAAATAPGTTATPTVQVPGDVQAGDAMLLFVTVNKSAVDVTTPAGWELVGQQSSSTAMTTLLYQKVATASDAGSTVTAALSVLSKVDLTLLAYSGASATDPVTQFQSGADNGGAAHTTPTVAASADGTVVTYWADKSSAATGWTAPAGATERSESLGTGSGYITSLSAESGPVAAGAQIGGLTATSTTAARATTWTILLGAS